MPLYCDTCGDILVAELAKTVRCSSCGRWVDLEQVDLYKAILNIEDRMIKMEESISKLNAAVINLSGGNSNGTIGYL